MSDYKKYKTYGCFAKLCNQLFTRWFFDNHKDQKYKYAIALDNSELINEFLTYLTDIRGVAALEDYYITSDIKQILKDGYQLDNMQAQYPKIKIN